MSLRCPSCGIVEHGVALLCRRCWFRLPAKERIALSGMYRRKADVTTKLAKCVRRLKGTP